MLSVLAHGGAVVTVVPLVVQWLAGNPPASPPALYVDLVEPVRATSERTAMADTRAPRPRAASPVREDAAPGSGVPATPPRSRERSDALPLGASESMAKPPSEPATPVFEIARPPAAPVAPELRAGPPVSSPAAARDVAPAPPVAAPAVAPQHAPAPPPLPAAPSEEIVSVSPPTRAASPGRSSEEERGGPIASSSSSGGVKGLAIPSGAASTAAPSGGDASSRAGGGATDVAGFVPGDAQPSSGGDGGTGSTGAGGIPPEYDAYVRALRQRVQDRLVYPWMAARRGQQGVVELEVRVGAEGRLVGVEVVAGAHAETLRTAAVTAVRGAAPFPFPPGVPGRPLVIRLPVEFQLR
jgi:TonB family protein